MGILSLCSVLLVTYSVPLALEYGASSEVAALMISTFAGSAFIGKFILGWLGDLFSKRRVMILIAFIGMLGWALMVVYEGVLLLAIAVGVVGFAIGGTTPLWGALIALYYGAESFGRVKGAMTLAMLVFTVTPAPLGGYLYDLSGSFAAGFAYLWWSLPVAALAAWLLPEKKSSH